jgi:hypothetical protein
MNSTKRRIRLASVCVAAAIALAACGSSSSSAGSRTSGAAATAVTGTNTPGPNPNVTESAPPGDIPDNQAYVAFAPAGAGYTMRVPEGWAMTHVGPATLFTDKYNSIRIEKLAAATAPTAASASATEVPSIKAHASGFVPGSVTTVHRRAGTAIKITYRADSPSNPVTGKVVVQDVERYEFWRNGSEVVITLSASLGSDNVDPWRIVTDSFQWSA